MSTEWTDSQVEMLKALLSDGLSASQISAQIGGGHSRNSVIGKVHRSGFAELRPVKIRPKSKPKPKLIEKKPPSIVRPEVVQYELSETDIIEYGVAVFALESKSCRWPIGDPGKNGFRFCLAEAETMLPYCTTHCHMAYPNWLEDEETEEVK